MLSTAAAAGASSEGAGQAKPGWEILTPPASKSPRVNGPAVFGVRPGSPFFYQIPATGERPLTYAVDGLPDGLAVDAATGIVSGKLMQAGEHRVTLRVKNALGSAEKAFRIVVGDAIALTPPMGWNSWNCWGEAVSQEKVLSSARAMVEKGLRDHGWSYINVDDSWQGARGGPTKAIQPNQKFPNMQQLADEVHKMGLKFGIYSTPWRGSYAGFIGGSSDHEDGSYEWIVAGDHTEYYQIGKDRSDPKRADAKKWANWTFGKYSFAEQDAAQWAAWGVDYLKYDWFPNDPAHTEAMLNALRKSGRDIVYSLSNTGLYDLAPAYARLANAWRTTGDISDSWHSMSSRGFSQDRWAAYTGPGHWSDPDMLVIGQVGWGPQLRATHLTANEQYTHISLWSLLAAPLLIGCDIAQIDDFTLGLLTNDEVIAVNQDALGKQATQSWSDGDKVVYTKTLEDGSRAVGIFNRGETEATIALSWGPWGSMPTEYRGKFLVRDLWRQKDLGTFSSKFETKVAPHGVVLVRFVEAKE